MGSNGKRFIYITFTKDWYLGAAQVQKYLTNFQLLYAKYKYKIENIIHLLDDFLTVDPASEEGHHTMALLTLLFKRLGIPLSVKKTIGPVTESEYMYLGIILDSVNMLAHLPQDKVLRLSNMLQQFSKKDSCIKLELISLLGLMSFASKVKVLGHSFMSYLLKLTKGVNNNHEIVYLNKDCKQDMKMWLNFLENWNGISFFVDCHA